MTLEDAKDYLRLETTQDDALVERLVASARGLCEVYLGQLLVHHTLTQVLKADGRWHRLDAGPVAAITAVERAGPGGFAADAVGDHAIDIDPSGHGWVRASPGGDVRVSYVAGMAADATGVPAAIAQGITRLAAHLYVHRDAAAEPPAAVATLWRPFRRLRLGLETRA